MPVTDIIEIYHQNIIDREGIIIEEVQWLR